MSMMRQTPGPIEKEKQALADKLAAEILSKKSSFIIGSRGLGLEGAHDTDIIVSEEDFKTMGEAIISQVFNARGGDYSHRKGDGDIWTTPLGNSQLWVGYGYDIIVVPPKVRKILKRAMNRLHKIKDWFIIEDKDTRVYLYKQLMRTLILMEEKTLQPTNTQPAPADEFDNSPELDKDIPF